MRFLDALSGWPGVSVDLGSAITYIRGEHSLGEEQVGSVQFWRSQLHGDVLTKGRLALSTTGFGLEERLPPSLVAEAEALFRGFRRQIQKDYVNGVLQWLNPSLPPSATNPTRPDKTVWVGPAAARWWRASPEHKLKQFPDGAVEAIPVAKGHIRID